MIKAAQDFWAGLIFLAAGLFILWAGWNYPMGTAGRMSYGYFPKLLAGALCMVGAIVVARALVVPGTTVSRLTFRPLLPLVAVLGFALLLRPAGLIVATLCLILISCLAAERFRPLDVIGIAVVLIPFNWLVFVRALGLPLPVLPSL
jgi:hypothetical protein